MNTILICDDDKDIVSALDIYLTSEGYATVKAYDGQECLRLAEREPGGSDPAGRDDARPGRHPHHGQAAGRAATCPSSCSPPRARTATKSWG